MFIWTSVFNLISHCISLLIVTLKEELTNNFHKRLVVLKYDAIQLQKKVSLKSWQTFKFKPSQYSRGKHRADTISKFRTPSSLVLHIDVLLWKVWHFVIVSWISTQLVSLHDLCLIAVNNFRFRESASIIINKLLTKSHVMSLTARPQLSSFILMF